jgi:hypothetical protein
MPLNVAIGKAEDFMTWEYDKGCSSEPEKENGFLIQCPFSTLYWQEVNILPAGKGEAFSGPSSISAEKAMKYDFGTESK